MSTSESTAQCCGVGFSSPQEAQKAPRERYIFVTCANTAQPQPGPDALCTVDVDPRSETYLKVVCQLTMPNVGDEVHHMGWNACSSCFGDRQARRSHLVLPCLNSSRIYIVDASDPKRLRLHKIIEGEELAKKADVNFPHTAHCLADGTVMLSTLADGKGRSRGDFILLDAHNGDFALKGKWPASEETKLPKFNYDFWYQPRHNVMLSTEWGNPEKIKGGFNSVDVGEGHYGNKVHVWDWAKRELLQSIELPSPTGITPLEVRFLHDPAAPEAHAFVGCALGSSIYHLHRKENQSDGSHLPQYTFTARLAATIPPRRVVGWALPEMPALVTDILVSMDDRYLFTAQWLHGDVRQYDITDPFNIRLVGQLFVGGSLHAESGVREVVGEEEKEGGEANEKKQQSSGPPLPPHQLVVKGKRVEGGPQMLQLSLDGKRLYVTTSLYSVWDRQFYPQLAKNGAVMLQLDVNTERGGLALNPDFLVDFSQLPGGPYLAHEMRFPGGDSTSDIWL